MQQGISFEIVPGITSGIAAAAYAVNPRHSLGIQRKLCFCSAGHRKDSEHDAIKWDSLAKGVDTLAIYMGVRNLPYICNS